MFLAAAAALVWPAAAQVKTDPGPEKTGVAMKIYPGPVELSGGATTQGYPGAEKIAVLIDGAPFTEFFVAGAAVTKPYLHPLRAPSGTYVTRMWPMEKVAEEAGIAKPDHPASTRPVVRARKASTASISGTTKPPTPRPTAA